MSAIAFEDYLSEDRKREIAEAAFRDVCEQTFRDDAERIFSNAAYKAVWAVVDKQFDGKAAELVAAKIPDIIDKLSEYSVFRSQPIGRERESPGYAALRSAVHRHSSTIGERVAYLAGEISKQDVIDILLDGDLSLKITHNKDTDQ